MRWRAFSIDGLQTYLWTWVIRMARASLVEKRKPEIIEAPGLEYGVKAITPQEAENLLEAMKSLPRPNRRRIIELKAKLLRGNLKIDGEPVTVMADGTVTGGADKLYASIQTGVSFPTVYVYGLKQGDPAVSGDFARRTRSDFLKSEGVKFPTMVAGTYSLLYLAATKGLYQINAQGRISHADLKFYQEALGDLEDEVELCQSIPTNVIPRVIAVSGLVLLSQVDHEKAFAFYREIGKACQGYEAHKAAELLVRTSRAEREKTVLWNRDRVVVLGYIFEAWEHYNSGEVPDRFTFEGKRSGKGYIAFPPHFGVDKIPAPEISATDVPAIDRIDKDRLSERYEKLAANSKIRVSLEDIDPTTAAEWLDHNTKNRNIREKYVERYQRMMRVGRWEVNGKSIKWAGGLLRDGQHRLLAAVREQLTLRSFVVYGLDEDVFIDLDQEGKVSLRQVLSKDGFSNAQGLASALSALQLFPEIANVAALTGNPDTKISDLTYDEQKRLLEVHPALVKSAERYGGRYLANLFSQGLIVAMHYVMAKEDEAAANEFFDILKAEPGRADPDHPGQILRSTVTRHMLSARRMLPLKRQIGVLKLAYETFHSGNRLTQKAIEKKIKEGIE